MGSRETLETRLFNSKVAGKLNGVDQERCFLWGGLSLVSFLRLRVSVSQLATVFYFYEVNVKHIILKHIACDFGSILY